MDREKTQNRVILRHLQAGGKLTALEALDLCGTMRLSARIMDLRNAGYDIVTNRVTKKSRAGSAMSYAEYVMPGANGEKKRRGRPPKNK